MPSSLEPEGERNLSLTPPLLSLNSFPRLAWPLQGGSGRDYEVAVYPLAGGREPTLETSPVPSSRSAPVPTVVGLGAS